MPAPEIATHAIALGYEPRGDRFISYRILSSERGALNVLVRRSSKPGAQTAIDLFDEGEYRIELKPGSVSGFLKEAQIIRRRTELAKRYRAFEFAARFAKLILSNPTHNENLDGIFTLMAKGLDSWEQGKDPASIYLKCLYLYCRDEGYPVKEEWAAQMPTDERTSIARTLNQPPQETADDPDAVKGAIDSLERYLRDHTHIRLGSA